jgi:hypothetical protein
MKNLAHSASFESLDKNAPSKAGTKHLVAFTRPLLPIGSDKRISFPAFSGASAEDVHGPWSREAAERSFLVAEVACIAQVFYAALIR